MILLKRGDARPCLALQPGGEQQQVLLLVGLALQVILLQLPVDGADGAVKPHPGGRPAGAGRGNRMIPLTIRLEKALEQRAHTAHLKPALAALYKATSAVSTGSYRRRSVASAAAAAEPRSRTGRWWHRTAPTTAISGRYRWCRALQGSRALTRACRLTAGAGSKPPTGKQRIHSTRDGQAPALRGLCTQSTTAECVCLFRRDESFAAGAVTRTQLSCADVELRCS